MEVGHRVISLMESGAGRQSQTSAASFHLPELPNHLWLKSVPGSAIVLSV